MLLSPTANDTRSSLADWLELQALFSARRLASRGDLINAFDIADDEREGRFSFDTEAGEELDQGILEETQTALVENVFDELEFRATCLGSSYPFIVDSHRRTVRAEFLAEIQYGQVVYTFCLLATALREKVVSGLDEQDQTIRQLELLFQVCACLAAGGYFGGEVSSFGFPRAEGNAFLPALKTAYDRFGYGDVRIEAEEGNPHATKDGGIDVIAWRDHPDRLPAKLYSLGQCASGKNWKQKPVASEFGQFHGTWFTTWPATFCVPALYIPFLIHDELTEPANDSYVNVRARHVAFHERKFGVIFDRLRISFHAAMCMASSTSVRDTVDGTTRAIEVATWVNETIAKAKRRAEAA
jgi:hypothetical protein